MRPSAQNFLFDWSVRPIEKEDLKNIATWIAALTEGETEEIYGSLLLEFHQAQLSGFRDLYAGLVDDQLICYISGYTIRDNGTANGKSAAKSEYGVYLMLNTLLDNYEELWAPTWNCTIQHFFLQPDIDRIRVHFQADDPLQTKIMVRMGFEWIREEESAKSLYTDIYACQRDDFQPLF